jgi:hypothetical protein
MTLWNTLSLTNSSSITGNLVALVRVPLLYHCHDYIHSVQIQLLGPGKHLASEAFI